MSTDTPQHLSEDDIITTFPGAAPRAQSDADGLDGDATDTRDGDATDGDATDTTDGDATDGDATDDVDVDGRDA